MKPEVHKAWIDALRSGKYRQTRNSMVRVCYDDGSLSHCCLSVLNDLGSKANPDIGLELKKIGNEKYAYYQWHEGPGKEASVSRLATVLCEWAGVDQNFKINGISPVILNDRNNKSFKEIADLLEQAGPENVK